jgi:hypothetical protein
MKATSCPTRRCAERRRPAANAGAVGRGACRSSKVPAGSPSRAGSHSFFRTGISVRANPDRPATRRRFVKSLDRIRQHLHPPSAASRASVEMSGRTPTQMCHVVSDAAGRLWHRTEMNTRGEVTTLGGASEDRASVVS